MKLAVQIRTTRKDGTWIISSIPVLILAVLIFISEVPIISRNVSNLVFYGLVGLLILFSLNPLLNMSRSKKYALLVVLAYFALLFIYLVLHISSAALSYYSTTVRFFVFMLAMLMLLDHLSDRQKVFLLIVVFLTVGYTLVDNVRLFLRYGAVQYVSLFQRERFTSNSINTQFTTALMLFSGVLLSCYLNITHKLLKFGSFMLFLFFTAFNVIIAQRVTNVALSVLMISLLLLFNSKRSGGRVVLLLFVIAVLFFAMMNIDAVLNYLEQITSSVRIAKRINQIRVYLQSGELSEAGGSLNTRYNLIMQSLKTWSSSFENVVFGVGDHRLNNNLIGNHSHFIDELARYGLVGMIVIIPMMISVIRQVKETAGITHSVRLKRHLSVILSVFIVRGFLGGIFEATIGIQLFIVIPIVFSLMDQWLTEIPLNGSYD